MKKLPILVTACAWIYSENAVFGMDTEEVKNTPKTLSKPLSRTKHKEKKESKGKQSSSLKQGQIPPDSNLSRSNSKSLTGSSDDSPLPSKNKTWEKTSPGREALNSSSKEFLNAESASNASKRSTKDKKRHSKSNKQKPSNQEFKNEIEKALDTAGLLPKEEILVEIKEEKVENQTSTMVNLPATEEVLVETKEEKLENQSITMVKIWPPLKALGGGDYTYCSYDPFSLIDGAGGIEVNPNNTYVHNRLLRSKPNEYEKSQILLINYIEREKMYNILSGMNNKKYVLVNPYTAEHYLGDEQKKDQEYAPEVRMESNSSLLKSQNMQSIINYLK